MWQKLRSDTVKRQLENSVHAACRCPSLLRLLASAGNWPQFPHSHTGLPVLCSRSLYPCLLVSSLYCGAIGGGQAWIKAFSPSNGIFFPKDIRLEGCSGLPARLPPAPQAGARLAAVWALDGLAKSRAGRQVTAPLPWQGLGPCPRGGAQRSGNSSCVHGYRRGPGGSRTPSALPLLWNPHSLVSELPGLGCAEILEDKGEQ